MAVTSEINIMVAIPGVASFAPNENYNFDKFICDEINDSYICPQQQILTTMAILIKKINAEIITRLIITKHLPAQHALPWPCAPKIKKAA